VQQRLDSIRDDPMMRPFTGPRSSGSPAVPGDFDTVGYVTRSTHLPAQVISDDGFGDHADCRGLLG
jgi:hypothetical protein